MAADRSAAARLTEAFMAADSQAMVAELAPDAVFHSPVAEYESRERIGVVLAGVTQVVTDVRAGRRAETGEESVLTFTADIAGSAGDGVLLAVGDGADEVTSVTLMLRPLAALLNGVDRMKVLLGAAEPRQIEQSDLPGDGTRRFEGDGYGAGVSFFLARTPPGRGPGLHRHPYEETFIVHDGRVTFTVDDRTVEAGPGEIVIAPPGSAHKFVNAGDTPLHMTNIHPRPRMSQEDLE